MKTSELRSIIREVIRKILNEDDQGVPKSTFFALGPQQDRFVIEGPKVKANKDKIIKLSEKYSRTGL